MDFAGLVPGDTPFENQTKTPPPGVGPYKITKVAHGPRFRRSSATTSTRRSRACPRRKLDKITINEVTNDSRAITDVLQNKMDYFDDPPTSDALREFREQGSGALSAARRRTRRTTSSSTTA